MKSANSEKTTEGEEEGEEVNSATSEKTTEEEEGKEKERTALR